eukprot:m.36196 g.36196  ORF g.36196 m.36196 type:complete len:226 (-) comp5373_c0_seq1:235-912(-)
MPVGYVQQWWDEQVPDAVVSFYIASEINHHVGCHDESLYMLTLMFISTVEITANDNIMLIRQVNSGGVITSDVVLSAVTTESAIEIKLMQQRGGVGTTLFQTANKKEGYKPKVFKITASAIGIDMPVCKNHPECEWNIHTNPWQTDFDGVPTELMYHRDCMPPELMDGIAAAPAQDEQHAVEPETVDELMARIEQLELLKEVIISHDDDDDAAPVREFAAHEDTD